MNEELKNQLTLFLTKALDIAEKGVNTAGEQIPLVLQEILNYQIACGVFCSVLAVLFFVLLIISFFIFRWGDDKGNLTLLTIGTIGLISSTLLMGICFVEATVLIKALFSPRLVIIDYLKGLL